jgi:hypothetical protein
MRRETQFEFSNVFIAQRRHDATFFSRNAATTQLNLKCFYRAMTQRRNVTKISAFRPFSFLAFSLLAL